MWYFVKLYYKVSKSYVFTTVVIAIVLLLNGLVMNKLEVLAEVTNRLYNFGIRLVNGVSWLSIHEPLYRKVFEIDKIVEISRQRCELIFV